jgi:tetratricopeptide (TPR) repeat protein
VTTGDETVDREQLEADRAFLLRSLADLEREREAGNLDDNSYQVLRDDYTARAATVLRSLQHNRDERPVAAPMSWARRIAIAVAVLAFIGFASWWLSNALGTRGTGQFASGNPATQTNVASRVKSYQAAIAADPKNASLHLAYARFLISQGSPSQTTVQTALIEYGKAARLDPKNAEAPAYGGWLLYRYFKQVDCGLVSENAALNRNPQYPDAQFFKAMMLFEGKADPHAAIPLFQSFLVSFPDNQLTGQVTSELAAAVKADKAGGSVPTTTAPTTDLACSSSTVRGAG